MVSKSINKHYNKSQNTILFEMDKIARYIHPQYIKRVVSAFTAGQVALLLGIATVWILAVTTDNSVALTWGLWRLVDMIPLLVSIGVWILVDNIVSSSKPAILVFAASGVVVVADLASLIWFGILFRDCTQYHHCLNTDADPADCDSVDPLCVMGDFNRVSLYYLVLTCILALLNLAYGAMVGGMLLLLSMEKYGVNSNGYADRIQTSMHSREDQVLIRYRYYQWAVNFLLLGWVFIAVEVCYLTDYSNVKYYLFFHIIQGWCVVQTMISGAYADKTANRISIIVNIISLLASALGGLLVFILYYEWNCNPETDSHSDFANTKSCEVTPNGARYFIALNAFVVLMEILRIPLYARTIRNQTQLTSRNSRDVANSYQVDQVEGTPMSSQLIQRHVAIQITSGLTGQPIYF
jgi:hypothetical protein